MFFLWSNLSREKKGEMGLFQALIKYRIMITENPIKNLQFWFKIQALRILVFEEKNFLISISKYFRIFESDWAVSEYYEILTRGLILVRWFNVPSLP